MSSPTKLIVLTCRTCPFFREIPGIGMMMQVFTAGTFKGGWCAYSRKHGDVSIVQLGLPPGPERDEAMARHKDRLIIENRDEVPAQCPLRAQPITVSLGS